ncbi:MAG: hypothetical protein ABI183_15520 [Polyangiaceae bacterium]
MKALTSFFAVLAIVGFSRVASADDVSSVPDNSPRFLPRFTARLDGGLAYRALYGSHFWGGEITATGGVELRPGAILLTTDLLYGKTEFGLTTWNWHLTPMFEFRFNRLRFGLGPSLGYLQIARVTTPDHPLYDLSFGGVGQLTVDIVQYDVLRNDGRPTPPHAFYGGIRFNVDSYLEQNDSHATTYGPTFMVGYRY